MQSMPLKQWAKGELPAEVKAAWKDPDALHLVIASALEAGLLDEIKDAAERLGELRAAHDALSRSEGSLSPCVPATTRRPASC